VPLNYLARGEYVLAIQGGDERVLEPVRIN
jgi:hypothetical protein